jgi:hypothetical protein
VTTEQALLHRQSFFPPIMTYRSSIVENLPSTGGYSDMRIPTSAMASRASS